MLQCDAFLIDRLVTSLGLFAEAQNLVLRLDPALAHTDFAQVQTSTAEASAEAYSRIPGCPQAFSTMSPVNLKGVLIIALQCGPAGLMLLKAFALSKVII